MTNKEAIKFLQQLYPNGGHCWLDEQRMEAIGMAVKALQEEPVSEELEQAAKYYIPDESYHMIMESEEEGSGENVYDYVQMIEMFKAGAKWQKEQLMAKAFDGDVLENYDGKVIKYDDTILDEKLSDCKIFDKVKIIVINED